MKNSAERHERSQRGQQSRADILTTAAAIFAEFGPEATTLRTVARSANVNIATLMYYFPNKESLFGEVLHMLDGGEMHIVETWRRTISDQQLAQLDSLKECLSELGIMIIERVIADPSRFRLGVYTALETTPPSQTGASSPAQENSANASPEKAVVRAVLERAIELGTIHCETKELEDYIDGYTYLSRGFAIAHIKEIALGSTTRQEISRRFKKIVRRYVNNMLPGQ